MSERLAFKSAGAVRKLSLPVLQRLAGQNGAFLTAIDVVCANDLLAKGWLVSKVVDLAIGWANEYARVSLQEGREAARFEAAAYGTD